MIQWFCIREHATKNKIHALTDEWVLHLEILDLYYKEGMQFDDYLQIHLKSFFYLGFYIATVYEQDFSEGNLWFFTIVVVYSF